MSYLLDQAKEAMDRAKREAERARHDYNQKARTFNEAKARYDRLAARQMDIELELALEREKAIAEGNHVLAALLSSPPR
jgi:thymidylate kinase